jgi:hypothetical protein
MSARSNIRQTLLSLSSRVVLCAVAQTYSFGLFHILQHYSRRLRMPRLVMGLMVASELGTAPRQSVSASCSSSQATNNRSCSWLLPNSRRSKCYSPSTSTSETTTANIFLWTSIPSILQGINVSARHGRLVRPEQRGLDRNPWLPNRKFRDCAIYGFWKQSGRGYVLSVGFGSGSAIAVKSLFKFRPQIASIVSPLLGSGASWFSVFRSSIARPTDALVYASSDTLRCHLQD